jgi:hypothetical protein
MSEAQILALLQANSTAGRMAQIDQKVIAKSLHLAAIYCIKDHQFPKAAL